jgi:hypothetical protein
MQDPCFAPWHSLHRSIAKVHRFMNSTRRSLSVLAAACAALFAIGATPETAPPPVEGARLVAVLDLRGELFHVQGVDLDRDHIWVTSVDVENKRGYIHQFDRTTGAFERRREISDGPRYHPGGISVQGDSIWVAVAEYKPNSTGVLEEIDKKSLTVRRRIFVADHLGCVAVSDRTLVAGNWDSRLLYVFDRNGRQIRVVENPSRTRFQDIKFADGKLVGSGDLTSRAGAIEWFAWPSLKPLAIRHSGTTDRGNSYTREGMALHGPDLFLVPEDGPSRLFHFKLTPGGNSRRAK